MLLLILSQGPFLAKGQNVAPTVALLWPDDGETFSAGTLIKLKADATYPDSSAVNVQFFADTNLIGTATNPPFNVVWRVGSKPPSGNGSWRLQAVAIDNHGITAESLPVQIFDVTGLPPLPVFSVASPRKGQLFAAPATFSFSAEQLASPGDFLGAVEFIVNTSSVGIVTQSGPFVASTPLYETVITNLNAGDYDLCLRFYGYGQLVAGETIHVVRLGIDSPRLTSDGRFEFDIVTSFTGSNTVVEVSSNLSAWIPTNTNRPSQAVYTFTDPGPSAQSIRYYRVRVPSQ